MHQHTCYVTRLGVACVVAAAAVSCAGSAPDLSGPAISVEVGDNTFAPTEVTVTAGTVVEWTNRGAINHNIVSVELGDLRANLNDFTPGAAYRYRFDEAGRYLYFCSIHGTRNATGQHGYVTVTAT